MSVIRPLGRVQVRGLASLRDVSLDLTTDVTVLIGANGSGKSNLVSALELLGRIVDGRLQETVARGGGMTRLLFRGQSSAEDAAEIFLGVWEVPGELVPIGYAASLKPAQDDEALLNDAVYVTDPSLNRSVVGQLGASRESRLAREAPATVAPDVHALLRGCRVFHFDDAGENAPPTRWATVGDDEALRWNGENLAAVLLRLHEESPFDYQRIVEVIRSVAPFFDDFVLRPSRDGIRLRWRQRGVDPVFAGSQLSDGTLRFICLATLLLSPFRPATIVLDEPELGLHPFALHQLAGMIRSAATGGRRVVLATQSVPLVSLFGVNEIAVLEREAGATVVHRPDPETLAAFLDDYSLGTLWEMNLLHGHPAPEV